MSKRVQRIYGRLSKTQPNVVRLDNGDKGAWQSPKSSECPLQLTTTTTHSLYSPPSPALLQR